MPPSGSRAGRRAGSARRRAARRSADPSERRPRPRARPASRRRTCPHDSTYVPRLPPDMAGLLILGAGYLGAAIAARAIAAGDEVTLADNWYATERSQAEAVGGARVVDADVRSAEDVRALLADRPDRVIFTAAQASRPISFEDPDYTEQTNVS